MDVQRYFPSFFWLSRLFVSAVVAEVRASSPWTRLFRIALVTVLICCVWLRTDFPWDEPFRAFVWLNAALGIFVLSRVIGWPEYLFSVSLTAILAVANWRRF